MRNQSLDGDASDRGPALDQAAERGAVAQRRADVPEWARAFGDTLPVIAGRGESRAWPRVIP